MVHVEPVGEQRGGRFSAPPLLRHASRKLEGVADPTMTAADCVARLTQLGFRVGQTGVGMTLLRKDDRRVIVPHVTIEPPMLRAILRSAGISEAEFSRVPGRSGVYTKTTPPPHAAKRRTGH